MNSAATRRLVTCQLAEANDERDTASMVVLDKIGQDDVGASLALAAVEDVNAATPRDLRLLCKYEPQGDAEVEADDVKLIAIHLKDQ